MLSIKPTARPDTRAGQEEPNRPLPSTRAGQEEPNRPSSVYKGLTEVNSGRFNQTHSKTRQTHALGRKSRTDHFPSTRG